MPVLHPKPRWIVALLALLTLIGCGGLMSLPEAAIPTTQPTAARQATPVSPATPTKASAATVTPQQTPSATLPDEIDGLQVVDAAQLPSEARTTLKLIAQNGPFPYRQDGAVFQNRERILPIKSTGYYHEYTVETPGSDDRGARRIVTGREGEIYYTDDHYQSFVRVRT